MSASEMNPVVVAVGHDPIDAALRFAAAEARRNGCGLHLVHALRRQHDGPESILVTMSDREFVGRQALEAARERARDYLGEELRLSAEILHGPVVSAVVSGAAEARMIVLEHRDLSTLRRVMTRSTASGVAARARVPVVSVPARWDPDAEQPAERTVVVGIDIPDRSEQILRVAAQQARSRGAILRVIHTWSLPAPYEDLVVTRTEDDRWGERANAEIKAVIESLGAEASGVEVRVETVHAPAPDALIAASREAELLVVGRHDPVVPFGSHLGPVARAVLNETACPILLADPRPVLRWGRLAEDVAQQAGV
ncbi:universal stress protein [Nocardioides sp. GY 10113]|uniref:universal stress protein n=1 Tax=Nocardioides sp. GY 10113 TaxID=2569761 RepID=UPI0010A821B5|nr:universal stress protein [Nocardioides sp. GY 10113]TIC83251.1 universal stress protein [Nocardioides sp. GY 10113]